MPRTPQNARFTGPPNTHREDGIQGTARAVLGLPPPQELQRGFSVEPWDPSTTQGQPSTMPQTLATSVTEGQRAFTVLSLPWALTTNGTHTTQEQGSHRGHWHGQDALGREEMPEGLTAGQRIRNTVKKEETHTQLQPGYSLGG